MSYIAKYWNYWIGVYLYPMHGSTSIIADILFLSTSIFRAEAPVLRVPSGHTQTKNLSTHLEELTLNAFWVKGCTYLTFFMIFPQVIKTFSGSFFEGWDTVGFAYLLIIVWILLYLCSLTLVCQEASFPKQLGVTWPRLSERTKASDNIILSLGSIRM